MFLCMFKRHKDKRNKDQLSCHINYHLSTGFPSHNLIIFHCSAERKRLQFHYPFCSLYFDFQHFHRDYVVFSAADYVPNKVLSPRSNSDQFK